jgi:anti-sigma regulatory factor (Ser/Thr protein kinase)
MADRDVSHKSVRVPVLDTSHVGEARRSAAAIGQQAGLDETAQGRLALVVSEAATNVARHGGGGELVMRRLADARQGVEVVAFDRGPGIPDISRAMQDGYSTRGTNGGGLGAISRLSSRFDIASAPGAGTIVLMQVWKDTTHQPTIEIGAICIPIASEMVCGDDWQVRHDADCARVFIADGLGHGISAEEASNNAVRVFGDAATASSIEVLERVHAALRGGRGAAIAVATVDAVNGSVEFAGIGNIAGTVRDGASSKSMVSHPGTAGHNARRFGTFSYAWPVNGVIVLHSDGLSSHWNLDAFPGLARRHPSLIAAALFRDFARGRDDTTVVVCRRSAELAT